MAPTLTTSELQFTITRTFDAPRAVVWRAWTDADEMAVWLHPRGFTTPRATVASEPRKAGRFRYTMVGADGQEYPTVGEYLEFVEPERLVFTWEDPDRPADAKPVITVELAEHGADGAQTAMTFTMRGIAGQPGDDDVHDGWSEAFDELAAALAARH
jgi:uncharacterized protein YndB with AHSA1/START domain